MLVSFDILAHSLQLVDEGLYLCTSTESRVAMLLLRSGIQRYCGRSHGCRQLRTQIDPVASRACRHASLQLPLPLRATADRRGGRAATTNSSVLSARRGGRLIRLELIVVDKPHSARISTRHSGDKLSLLSSAILLSRSPAVAYCASQHGLRPREGRR